MRSRTRRVGERSTGLTRRTWVHDPLKLLLELRGRLHTFLPSASRTDRVREAPRDQTEKSPSREIGAAVENTERVFSGTRDISGIKYVAELLGSLTEKPQETRREICPTVTKANTNAGKLSQFSSDFQIIFYGITTRNAFNYFGIKSTV